MTHDRDVSFFLLPPEVRRQIYDYLFAGARATLDLENNGIQQCPVEASAKSHPASSNNGLSLLLTSRQCYTDALQSYHKARIVCVRGLCKETLHTFIAVNYVHERARTIVLEDFHVKDLTLFPAPLKLQRLALNGVKMWGGYMVINLNETPDEAFNTDNVLHCLSEKLLPSTELSLEDYVSRSLPDVHVVVNFQIGYQVMDKNYMRGIQDWVWACSYDVKTKKFDKRLAHRLRLW